MTTKLPMNYNEPMIPESLCLHDVPKWLVHPTVAHNLHHDDLEEWDFYRSARSTGNPIILAFGTTIVLTGTSVREVNRLMLDGECVRQPIIDKHHHCIIFSDPHHTENTLSQLMKMGVLFSERATQFYGMRHKWQNDATDEACEQAFSTLSFHKWDIISPPTQRTLLPHQRAAALTLAINGGGYLGDEVGLGKTGEFMCGFLLSEAQFPLVVVTKKSLVGECAAEWGRWLNGGTSAIVQGRKTSPIDPNAQLIVCNADILYDRVDDIIDCCPGGLVFDESHMMKNMSAKRTKGGMKLASWVKKNNRHPYVVMSSGTLFPNRPEELWAQLSIMGDQKKLAADIRRRTTVPDMITTKIYRGKPNRRIKPNDKYTFEWYFCKGHPTPFGWDNRGADHVNELHDMLHDYGLIRRKKSDVYVPTPPLVTRKILSTISPTDRDTYTVMEDEFRRYMMKEIYHEAEREHIPHQEVRRRIGELIGKLNSAQAVMQMTKMRTFIGQAKIASTVEWIHQFMEGNNKKLIIFAYHQPVIEGLINHPELQPYGVLSLVSGQSPVKVQNIKDRFQDPKGSERILVCYSGAREGHTLTAAHDVLIVEIPFVPSWVRQMAGRCWARMSEFYAPHECNLWLAGVPNSIDDYLFDMVEKKQATFTDIIDGGEDDDAIVKEDDVMLNSEGLVNFLSEASEV